MSRRERGPPPRFSSDSRRRAARGRAQAQGEGRVARVLEDRLLARNFCGEAHAACADFFGAARRLRRSSSLTAERRAQGSRATKRAPKHLQKLGRHRKLGEAHSTSAAATRSRTRACTAAPNERFNMAAAAGARVGAAAAAMERARRAARRRRRRRRRLRRRDQVVSAAALLLPAAAARLRRSSRPTRRWSRQGRERLFTTCSERPSQSRSRRVAPPAQGRRPPAPGWAGRPPTSGGNPT